MKKAIKFIKRGFFKLCIIEAQNNLDYYGELTLRFFKIKLISVK